ncbi:sigma 54-interacting transcriptional regulator [bacterium]|nr:sigma 54-interacting transcriptional regulator [bacterium]
MKDDDIVIDSGTGVLHEMLLKINDTLPLGIILMDGRGEICYVNEKLEKLVRHKRDKLLRLNALELFPAISEYLEQTLRETVFYYDLELTEFREPLWADLIPFSSGSRERFAAAVVRTSPFGLKSHGQLGLETKISREMAMILDASFDGFWICDAEGTVCWINRASADLNNISASAVVGRKMEDLVAQGVIDRSVTLEVYKKRKPVTFVQSMPSEKKILATGSPVLDESGNLALVIVNERDITELGELRQELEKSRKLIKGYRSELNQLSSQRGLSPALVYKSEKMRTVMTMASRAALADVSVLLQGEAGVGRLDIARSIHVNSSRRKGLFSHFDCSARIGVLAERELFGTGLSDTGSGEPAGVGLIEMADGGTLYLENVEALSPGIQEKLLHYLEGDRSDWPAGQETDFPDVRIIASGRQPLGEAVARERFRRDLAIRLSTVTIDIPTLRERIDDIPVLVGYYLQRYNRKNHAHKTIERRAVDLLRQYAFPENVRELSILVDQLAVLSPSSRITVADLPAHIFPKQPWLEQGERDGRLSLSEAVERVEIQMITDAFRLFSSQVQVAEYLGINQSTLSRKLSRYRLKMADLQTR